MFRIISAKTDQQQQTIEKKESVMLIMPMLATMPMFAAAGYSLVYLLGGGGLIGAGLIFVIAKMMGK
jgi:hypothetical protein